MRERAYQSGIALSGLPNYDFIVEADLRKLPFLTMQQPNAEGTAMPGDLGLGLGIEGDIPLDRIKRVWQVDHATRKMRLVPPEEVGRRVEQAARAC